MWLQIYWQCWDISKFMPQIGMTDAHTRIEILLNTNLSGFAEWLQNWTELSLEARFDVTTMSWSYHVDSSSKKKKRCNNQWAK